MENLENTEHVKQTRVDHDLLVRMDEKLNLLITKNGDHETRIRRIEMWGAMAIGISYALQFYFNYLR